MFRQRNRAWARCGVVGEVAGRQVQAVQLPGHAEANQPETERRGVFDATSWTAW